jgi:CubicO group peptidase (beta-lactamase class C family)
MNINTIKPIEAKMTIQGKILTFIFYLVCTQSNFSQIQSRNYPLFTPETQQMSSERLTNMLDKIKNEKYNIHSLLVKRNDSIVLDTYFYPFQQAFVHDLASVTKSITSLLVGIAIDKGFILDENQNIINYFPERNKINDKSRNIKIKDLLNMVSGFSCSWNDGEKELHQMMKSDDWVEYMFDLPFSSEPGVSFSYCSGNYYLLSEIIQRSTKMSCHQFASRYLFEPLSITETYWLENDKGVNQAWGDLYLTTYDLSKIGSLLINNGVWHDKRIISKDWISKLKPQYRINDQETYGYGWWFEDEQPDKIEAIGRGGQRLVIYKDKKLVIVMTGGGYDSGEIDNYVLESINDFKANNNNSIKLNQILEELSTPPKSIADLNFLKLFYCIVNREFNFSLNELGISSVTFEVRDHLPRLVLKLSDGRKEEHFIGINNQYSYGKSRELQLPMAIKGEWINNTTLQVEYNELCRINRYQFTFNFEKDYLQLSIKEDTNNIDVQLKSTREM